VPKTLRRVSASSLALATFRGMIFVTGTAIVVVAAPAASGGMILSSSSLTRVQSPGVAEMSRQLVLGSASMRTPVVLLRHRLYPLLSDCCSNIRSSVDASDRALPMPEGSWITCTSRAVPFSISRSSSLMSVSAAWNTTAGPTTIRLFVRVSGVTETAMPLGVGA